MTYARALHLAGRLERDTHTGWALTLERMHTEPEALENDPHARELPDAPVQPDAAEPEAAEPDEATAESERCVEFLPHSRAVWSERGRPARWRNLRRAA